MIRQTKTEPPVDVLEALGEFQVYCLAGRYPDSEPAVMDGALVRRELARAKETYAWLQSQFNG